MFLTCKIVKDNLRFATSKGLPLLDSEKEKRPKRSQGTLISAVSYTVKRYYFCIISLQTTTLSDAIRAFKSLYATDVASIFDIAVQNE